MNGIFTKTAFLAIIFLASFQVATHSQTSKDWTIVATYSIPGKASGLAWDGTYLYSGIYGSEGDHFYRFDPATGTSDLLFVNGTINDCYGMTWDGTALYITDHGTGSDPATAIRLDLSGNILSQFDLPDHYMSGIAYDNGDFWVATYYPDPGTVYKVDDNGNILLQFTSPGEQPWDICVENGNLWITDYNADMIYKTDMTGNVLESHESENIKPAGIVFDGTYLWYVDGGLGTNSTLYKIDLSGSGTPQITVPVTVYNYGTVAVGDSAVWNCTVQNTGTGDLVLSNLIVPNAVPIFHYLYFPITIAPGGSTELPLIFKPQEPVVLNTTVTIESNDLINPQVDLTLLGYAVYQGTYINVPVTSFDFGDVRSGSSSMWEMQIENNGTTQLQITDISFDGPDFYIDPGTSFPVTINSLQSTMVKVWFFPPDEGTYQTTAIISHNATGQEPVEVSLSGTAYFQEYLMGEELWSYTVNTSYDNSIKAITPIQDVTGDAIADIIACSEDGYVRCFNGNSTGMADMVWENEAGTVYAQNNLTTIQDIDGDGYEDVVVGLAWGVRAVKVISGKTGNLIWTFDTHIYGEGGWVYQVDAKYDFNGDGVSDVLCSTGNDGYNTGPKRFFCLDGLSGTPLWETYTDGPNFAVTGTADFTGDGKPDVVGGSSDNYETQGKVYGINGANGAIVWSFNVAGTSVWALERLDDITGDGIDDIVAGDFAGNYYMLDATNGNLQYQGGTGGGIILRFERMDDTDGDGYADIAVAHSGNNAVLFNGYNGQNIWLTPLADKCWNIDRIGDITGDGINDLVAGTLYSGNYCYFLDGTTGEILQQTGYPEAVDAISSIPDITGDGSPELVAGGRNGKISCLSGGLAISQISADFEATPLTGNAPLQVQFTDLSTGNITFWKWDFDNDGIIDTTIQNPVWIYTNAGYYTVKLIAGNDYETDTAVKFNYIYVDTATSIREDGEKITVSVSPNPVTGFAVVSLTLNSSAVVSIDIYNINGKKVSTLLHPGIINAGKNDFLWSPFDRSHKIKAGLYFVKITVDDAVYTEKIVVK